MPLSEIDQQILRHVARHRITTPEIVHRLFYPNESSEAVKSRLRRLRSIYLQSRPLYGRRVYYQLTPKAAALLSEPVEITRPLGRIALPRAYAALAYCCSEDDDSDVGARRMLSREEFHRVFSFLVQSGIRFQPQTYFADRDQSGELRLGRIVVDQAGPPDKLARKCVSIVRNARQHKMFGRLIVEDRFLLAVLTASPEMASWLQTDLMDRFGGQIRLSVEAVPELLDVLDLRHAV